MTSAVVSYLGIMPELKRSPILHWHSDAELPTEALYKHFGITAAAVVKAASK